VIGGLLGVTKKSGAIQAGIGSLVERMRGRERWMIPVLMGVFALGGTSYGMAEESLAFYALVITVMIAAGYDALVGAAGRPARLRDRRSRVDGEPVRDGNRVRESPGSRSAKDCSAGS
jgi:C4-dicarboxylate anaerobic carrier